MSSIWLYNTNDVYLNSFCFGLRPTINVNPHFLGFSLRTPSTRKKFAVLAQGISRYNISKVKAMDIQLYLPSLEEQYKVGSLQRKLDNLIALYQRKKDIYLLLKKHQIHSLISGHKEKAPILRFDFFNDDWDTKQLSEIGRIITGNTPSTTEMSFWSQEENSFIWITPTDIDSLFTYNSERKLSEEGWKVARVVPKNSVLVTCIASIGKNTVNMIDTAINQQINAIVPVYNDHLFVLFAIEKNKYRLKSLAGLTATSIINKTQFEKFTIQLPNLKEQEKVGRYLKKVEEYIQLQDEKLVRVQNLRKIYINKLFI